ncbi:two-component system connector SafA [Escherichia coli]|nr:two-component system connector SafA [Escherichia coli]
MHATIVKNKITQRDNYKGIMSVIVVVLLLTLTVIAIFSAIDQLVDLPLYFQTPVIT